MADYRLSSKIVSRGKNQRIVASSAYRAGERLYDKRYSTYHDYTRKCDVVYNAVMVPEHAGAWAHDRETLWNTVEAIETRSNSQLAREIQLSMPRELSREENIELARSFVQGQFVSRGMVADMAFHEPKASDGEHNPHFHILLTMRNINKDNGEFGKKNRSWNDVALLETWREAWANMQNEIFKKKGYLNVSVTAH